MSEIKVKLLLIHLFFPDKFFLRLVLEHYHQNINSKNVLRVAAIAMMRTFIFLILEKILPKKVTFSTSERPNSVFYSF